MVNNRYLLTVAGLLYSCLAMSQSADQNFIRTRTPRQKISTTAQLEQLSPDKNSVQTDIRYFDGLGRPLQSVQQQASPSGTDIVQPMAYDQYGRAVVNYLPYAETSGDGTYRPNALVAGTGLLNFYNPSGGTSPQQANGIVRTPYPYAGTGFEASPLDRVVEQGAPGVSWQLSTSGVTGAGHTVKTTYGSNTTATEVVLWTVNTAAGLGATGTTKYGIGQLFKTTTVDENGNSAITYTDKLNQVVCKKAVNGASTLVTYYVYDYQGNLCYVIPPLPTASGSNTAVTLPTSFTETNAVFLNFCYGYHYDSRNRQIEKKIPGKNWQYTVYNALNQPILTQDPNQLSKGIWMVTKYDALGRVVMTGEYSSASTRTALQGLANGLTNLWETFTNAATNYGYSHVSYPDISTGAGNKILTVSYYDSYDVIANTAVNPSSANFPAPSSAVDTLEKHPRSLPVATLVNVLGTANYLFTVTHYDIYGHVAKVASQNYVGGSPAANKFDTQESQYSFQALPVKTTRKHYFSASTPQLTINTWNTYDHMNRPLLAKQQYKTATDTGKIITVSRTDYNPLAQLMTKHLHSTNTAAMPAASTFLQHVNYRYNERGWLSRINNPDSLSDPVFTSTVEVFSEQLDYDKSTNGYTGVTPQYNGNIASLRWQTKVPSVTSETQEVKGYVFTYDPLNRLTNAAYNSVTSGASLYNEAITYDALGNILTLSRNSNASGTPLNNMTYSYMNAGVRSNRLMSITDSGSPSELQSTAYTYDANGSLVTDSKKSLITPIAYNELNLPSLVTFTTPGKTITYNYDARGKKLERIVKTGTTINEDRVYDDGIEYSGLTATALELVQTPEGRAIPSAGTYNLQYEVADHLGNVRALFADINKNGILTSDEILQKSDYYAFGREITPGLVPSPNNNYKYNNKEFQGDLGQYDYGARFYDPIIARTPTADPNAEDFMNFSPYVYAINNPMNVIDPDGRDAIFKIQRDKRGDIIGVTVSAKVYINGDGASKERANQLNKLAKGFFKSRESNGVTVSFDINYSYDDNKTANDLRPGENLLKFDNIPESATDRSDVDGHYTETTDEKGNKHDDNYSGNTGTIHGSGTDPYAIFHETGHLIGLSDRYQDDSSPRGATPFPGFEHDLMGDPYARPLSLLQIHYQGFSEAARKYGGKSFVNKNVIDIDSRRKFIHTPESDKEQRKTVKKLLTQ